jgi:hypothetical protein
LAKEKAARAKAEKEAAAAAKAAEAKMNAETDPTKKAELKKELRARKVGASVAEFLNKYSAKAQEVRDTVEKFVNEKEAERTAFETEMNKKLETAIGMVESYHQ